MRPSNNGLHQTERGVKVRRDPRAVLLLAATVASGCYSDVPLDSSPQVQRDERLFGSWRCVPLGADETETAVVTLQPNPDQGRTYGLTWAESGKEAEKYEAFTSLVDGKTVLNVREVGAEGAQWAFLRYALLRQNVVHVQMAGYKLFEGTESSPSAVRAVLTSGGANRFEEFSVCVRATTGSK